VCAVAVLSGEVRDSTVESFLLLFSKKKAFLAAPDRVDASGFAQCKAAFRGRNLRLNEGSRGWGA
jgi:hypothetical protein